MLQSHYETYFVIRTTGFGINPIRELFITPRLLYDLLLHTKVSADASSYGLGVALLHKQTNGQWKPVAYSSRAMTSTEQRYAQIECEVLAVTWACKRFTNYLLGMTFEIETDHKPLVSLLSIDELPLQIQCFKMQLMKYQYSISHVPSKSLVIADALSCAPSSETTLGDTKFSTAVDQCSDKHFIS